MTGLVSIISKDGLRIEVFHTNQPTSNAVADLGGGARRALAPPPPPPGNLKEYKKLNVLIYNALKHINSYIKCHFILDKIWQPIPSGVDPTTPPASPILHFIRPFLKFHQMCALNLNFDGS